MSDHSRQATPDELVRIKVCADALMALTDPEAHRAEVAPIDQAWLKLWPYCATIGACLKIQTPSQSNRIQRRQRKITQPKGVHRGVTVLLEQPDEVVRESVGGFVTFQRERWWGWRLVLLLVSRPRGS